ncbi:MAG TPA: ABC transporter ATP-binding protein [Chloroflexota bacterium]|nr:ABC transporter ATP-binding protein [Chloroflexota bacterium]
MSAHLRLMRIGFRYGDSTVLDDLSLDLATGSLAALIGPNGAGKTTLLTIASGAPRPSAGKVELDGTDLRQVPPKDRARRIALVPQALAVPFAFTVRELVGLGRTPYLGTFGGERDADRRAIERALTLTGTRRFAGRCVLDLSAGERQRVILAVALAQEPDLLLLDEPTANLDVAHQLAFFDVVRELNRNEGLTVLAAVHDLNLAALTFDRLIALSSGRIVADGSPRSVLTVETIRDLYGRDVAIVDHPTEPVPLVALMR